MGKLTVTLFDIINGTKNEKPDFSNAMELLSQEAEHGNPLALHDLGRMYADGLGCSVNHETSEQYYAQALERFLFMEQEQPTPYLWYRIGKMNASGLGTEENAEEAVRWFHKAADTGHKYAMYSLGCHYESGKGVEQNLFKAFDLFINCAEQDNAYAQWKTAQMLEKGIGTETDPKAAQRWYQKAFASFSDMAEEQPDDRLLYRLGKMHLDGKGTPVSTNAAKKYFEKAAQLGNVFAMENLSRLLLASDNPEDMVQAEQWLRQASESGSPHPMWQLAVLLENQKNEEASQWFEKALGGFQEQFNSKPSASLAYKISRCYTDGKGCEPDEEKAFQFLQEAAVLEHIPAMYRLGKELLPINPAAGLDWLKKAADLGHAHAAYKLAEELSPIPDHQGEAEKWYRSALSGFLSMAKEKPDAFLCFRIGKMFADGKGCETNLHKAIHWLEQAAKLENIYAMNALSKALQKLLPPNLAAAFYWCHQAAMKGDPYAQYQTGRFFFFGSGTEKDEEAALRWLRKSAENGCEQAAHFLQQIEEWQTQSVGSASGRLLLSLARLFEEKPYPPAPYAASTDKKLLQKIRRKKLAMGHAWDDREPKH